MRTLIGGIVVMMVFISVGCQEHLVQSDFTPPLSPQGLSTIAGDGFVEISWLRNREADLAGYAVFVSGSYNGDYEFIGRTRNNYFLDRESRNGQTYYYAVLAYDASGNESELSEDVAYETPRPDGVNVELRDYHASPTLAGYDFSSQTIGPYSDQYTDVFFESYNGIHYLDVKEDTDIQDMGYTGSLDEIREAPENGWSPTKDAQVIAGHTYVVWTWDNHFAKIRVVSVSASRIVFDWAYQLQEGNPRLKPAGEQKVVAIGEGARSRQ